MHATSVSVLLTIRTSDTPVNPVSDVNSTKTSSRHGAPTTVTRSSTIVTATAYLQGRLCNEEFGMSAVRRRSVPFVESIQRGSPRLRQSSQTTRRRSVNDEDSDRDRRSHQCDGDVPA